jgi:hypothetical protein
LTIGGVAVGRRCLVRLRHDRGRRHLRLICSVGCEGLGRRGRSSERMENRNDGKTNTTSLAPRMLKYISPELVATECC